MDIATINEIREILFKHDIIFEKTETEKLKKFLFHNQLINGKNFLHILALEGNVKLFDFWLENINQEYKYKMLNQKTDQGETITSISVTKEHDKLTDAFLNEEKDLTISLNFKSALQTAAEIRNLEYFEDLFTKLEDALFVITLVYPSVSSPSDLSWEYNSLFARIHKTGKEDLKKTDIERLKDNLLANCIKGNNIEVFDYLIKNHEEQIKDLNLINQALLNTAISLGNNVFINKILSYIGFEHGVSDKDGLSPAVYAVLNKNHQALEILLQNYQKYCNIIDFNEQRLFDYVNFVNTIEVTKVYNDNCPVQLSGKFNYYVGKFTQPTYFFSSFTNPSAEFLSIKMPVPQQEVPMLASNFLTIFYKDMAQFSTPTPHILRYNNFLFETNKNHTITTRECDNGYKLKANITNYPDNLLICEGQKEANFIAETIDKVLKFTTDILPPTTAILYITQKLQNINLAALPITKYYDKIKESFSSLNFNNIYNFFFGEKEQPVDFLYKASGVLYIIKTIFKKLYNIDIEELNLELYNALQIIDPLDTGKYIVQAPGHCNKDDILLHSFPSSKGEILICQNISTPTWKMASPSMFEFGQHAIIYSCASNIFSFYHKLKSNINSNNSDIHNTINLFALTNLNIFLIGLIKLTGIDDGKNDLDLQYLIRQQESKYVEMSKNNFYLAQYPGTCNEGDNHHDFLFALTGRWKLCEHINEE